MKVKNLAFRVYIFAAIGLITIILGSLAFFYLTIFQRALNVSKDTLQGIKASEYTSKIEISSNNLRTYLQVIKKDLADKKPVNTDDFEIESSDYTTNILGLAGEGKQIELISSVSDTLVVKTKDIESLTINLIASAKDSNKASETQATIDKIQALMAEINTLATSSRKDLTNSFAEGFNKILNYDSLAQKMAVIGLITIFIAILFVIIFINSVFKKINNITDEISTSSEVVNGSAIKVEKSSTELSELVTEQSASVHETATALDEISAMVDKTTEVMADLVRTSEESHEKTQKSVSAMKSMDEAIEEINANNEVLKDYATENNSKIGSISNIIQNITQKTEIINDIVFQTKLLSFNASVEAARAGEQGKGFAVVAEEVGKLATMSGEAAKEISEILNSAKNEIKNITQETQSSFENIIKKSNLSVDKGVESAKNCTSLIEAIAIEVTESKVKIQDLQIASTEQTQGIDNIKQAMGQLQEATNNVANLASNAAEIGKELSIKYNELSSGVYNLNGVINGKK